MKCGIQPPQLVMFSHDNRKKKTGSADVSEVFSSAVLCVCVCECVRVHTDS